MTKKSQTFPIGYINDGGPKRTILNKRALTQQGLPDNTIANSTRSVEGRFLRDWWWIANCPQAHWLDQWDIGQYRSLSLR